MVGNHHFHLFINGWFHGVPGRYDISGTFPETNSGSKGWPSNHPFSGAKMLGTQGEYLVAHGS